MASYFRRRDLVAIILIGVGVFSTVVISKIAEARRKAAQLSCMCNIKKIGLAFSIFAHDNNGLRPVQVSEVEGGAMEAVGRGEAFRIFQVLSNEFSVPKSVLCPADTRTTAPDWINFANTNVSYFVGVNAALGPDDLLLSGDRNLAIDGNPLTGLVQLGTNPPPAWTKAIHRNAGNIGLADGSVQQVTSELLKRQLATSGDATNRVSFPQ
jgi:prepilin-type processing-associated H-X9-DG protein